MGNKQNDNLLTKKNDIELQNELDFLGKVVDIRYGEIKIMKSRRYNKKIALKSLIYDQMSDAQNFFKQAKFQAEIELPTIIRLFSCDLTQTEEYCSSFYKLHLIYEYIEESLEQEIIERKNKKIFYTDREIINILDCVLSALLYFQSNEKMLEHLSPQNILIDEDRIYKLLDSQFMNFTTMYKQFLSGSLEMCYLSPELFYALKTRDYSPDYQYMQSETFTLGMILLEIATLKSVQKCYNFDNFSINIHEINELLEIVQNRYKNSEVNVFEIISKMLKINPLERPNFYEILEILCTEELPIIDPNNFENFEKKVEKIKKSANKEEIAFIGNLDEIDKKFNEVMKHSEIVQNKFNYQYFQHLNEDKQKNDVLSLFEQTEQLKRSSISAISEKEEFYDSSKLYELYLEEYSKLKSQNN